MESKAVKNIMGLSQQTELTEKRDQGRIQLPELDMCQKKMLQIIWRRVYYLIKNAATTGHPWRESDLVILFQDLSPNKWILGKCQI